MEGLCTGNDAPLVVREGGCPGRGVFANKHIDKGQWLCEYRSIVYPYTELDKHTHEYNLNREGSYIITSKHTVGGTTRLCWDATRRMRQYGRYLNHARKPNAALTSPEFVRGKWRIGFTAIRDIELEHEVVWDYGVGKEVEWHDSVLVDGVVVKPKGRAVTNQEVRLQYILRSLFYYSCIPQVVIDSEESDGEGPSGLLPPEVNF